ncbi:MAG: hypothetical protein RL154_186 [Pseudomonadota bacterium]|jgi:LPS export ABC transporter ATP-binding protein
MNHVLEAKNIVKAYKKQQVLHDVSAIVRSGESVCLLGPNGAGKTTLFYAICGLSKPNGGKILLDGIDITNLTLSQKATLGLAYLPQESSVFRDLSVEDNIKLACEIVYKDDINAIQIRIEELLAAFSIEHIRSRAAYQLSGGERRRVEIARSLALKPKFLLLDEPFAGVDPLAVADIQQIVKDLCKSGIGVLITDHSFREALAICERAYVLNEGTMLAHGTPKEIYANENVKRFYLGEAAQ